MQDTNFQFLPVAVRVKTLLTKEIVGGKYGGAGGRFLSVRELCSRQSVSLATAQKIMTMLKEEGWIEIIGRRYYLNEKLQEMQKKHEKAPGGGSKIFGLLVTDLSSPFFAEMAQEFERAAALEGAQVLVGSSGYQLAREKKILEDFVSAGVLGIAAFPSLQPGSEELYQRLRIPLAVVGRKLEHTKADSVLVDNETAGEMVSRHFLERGFEHVGYIGVDTGFSGDPRRRGFERGLTKNGITLKAEHTFCLSNIDHRNWDKHLSDLARTLSKKNRAAVFCFHDLIAVEMLRVCHILGIDVPGQLAVAGFDDLPIARQTYPQLTTIAYPHAELADLALTRLLEAQNADRSTRRAVSHLIEPHLVIRGSTDPNANRGRHPLLGITDAVSYTVN